MTLRGPGRLLTAVALLGALTFMPSTATAEVAPIVCEYDAVTQTLTVTATRTYKGEQYVDWPTDLTTCGAASPTPPVSTRVSKFTERRAFVGSVVDSSQARQVIYAPSGISDFELNFRLNYPVTDAPQDIGTLTAASDGLDFNSDGVLDIAIIGTDTWRIRNLYGQNLGGTIDLRRAPMPPGTTLDAQLFPSKQAIRFFGPTSGPIVQLLTGNGNDNVHTYGGDDRISVMGGNDRVWSRGGDDVIALNRGNDIAYAGAGNDQIYADGTWSWTPRVEAGNDRVYTGPGTNYVRLAGGQDLVIGGSGRDMVSTHHGGGYVLRLGGGMDQYEFSNGPRTGRYRRVVNCGTSRFDFLDVTAINDRSGRILPEYRSRAPRFIGCERKRRKYTGKIAYRFPYSVDATGERHNRCGEDRAWCPVTRDNQDIGLTGGWM
jgi:hypothetical protein